MLHADPAATGRAHKCDLAAGIDLSNPHDMASPAAGTGNFISVSGHTPSSQSCNIRSCRPLGVASDFNDDMRAVGGRLDNRGSLSTRDAVQLNAPMLPDLTWSDDVSDSAGRATDLAAAREHRLESDGLNICSPLRQNKISRELGWLCPPVPPRFTCRPAPVSHPIPGRDSPACRGWGDARWASPYE